MTWTRQVVHVFGRDLRRTWVLLLSYLVVLGVAVARALEWPPAMQASVGPVGAAVAVCAVIATVRVLLADDTTRADVFWAILPLDASAVATSKLTYVTLLLALSVGASLVTRAAWQLESFFSDRAGIDAYLVLAIILLGVALTASVIGTMSRVVLVVLGALAIGFVGRFVLDIEQQGLEPAIWWPVITVLVLGCAASIVRRYQVRGTTLLSKGSALGTAVVAMLFPVFGTQASPAWDGPSFDPAHTLDSVALVLPGATAPSCARQRIEVPIVVGTPVGWRVSLMKPTVDITRDDGSMISLSAPTWMQLAGGEGPMLPTNLDRKRLRVLGGSGDLPSLRTAVVFRIPAGDSGRTCGHVARLAMRMSAKTATGIEVMRVPLERTTRTDGSGYRARILAYAIRDSSVAITVRLSRMRDERDPPTGDLGGLDFALFNPVRGEVVKLRQSELSNYSSLIDLPGLQHWTGTFNLELDDTARRGVPGLSTWQGHAVLLMTAAKEEGRGSLRSPTVTVPPSP